MAFTMTSGVRYKGKLRYRNARLRRFALDCFLWLPASESFLPPNHCNADCRASPAVKTPTRTCAEVLANASATQATLMNAERNIAAAESHQNCCVRTSH